MTDKEFLYSMYDQALVDHAMESSKDFYQKATLEADLKLSKIVEDNGGKSVTDRLYDHIQSQMVFSYLHGASYAVANELTTTQPSEIAFSDFHKDVDFAVLFNFCDNDFGLAIEAGAKAYCDEFNGKLRQIDLYNDHEWSKNNYIKEFNELIKIESIKEIIKCGFLAERMKQCAEVICGRIPNAIDALESIESDLKYIPWDDDKTKWEKVGAAYVESGKFPRFITGTYTEINEKLKNYGHPHENPTAEFPVWCNGEVVILYMKNGYLTFVVR